MKVNKNKQIKLHQKLFYLISMVGVFLLIRFICLNLFYFYQIKYYPQRAKLDPISLKYFNTHINDSVSLFNKTINTKDQLIYINALTHARYTLSKNDTVNYSKLYTKSVLINNINKNVTISIVLNLWGLFICFVFLYIISKDPKEFIKKNFTSIYYSK